MTQSHDFPDLVLARPDQPSFEDALRDLLRNAPYLGIALLAHAAVFMVLAALKQPIELEPEETVLQGERPAVVEDFEPLDPPDPPEILPPEEPVVSEDITDSIPELDAPPSDEPIDALPADSRFDLSRDSTLGLGIGNPDGSRGIRGGHPPGSPGGTPGEAYSAVEDALEWLAAHQHPEGHWSAGSFDEMCGELGTDTFCDGRGNPAYDVGVTGLALLAFLGAGHTDKRGAHSDHVRAGLKFLRDTQRADGLLAPEWNSQGTYDQAIATLALCEAYARTRGAHLRKPAQLALDGLHALRTPHSGWRYAAGHPEMSLPERRADSSVTGWALLAMMTARKAGLPFDEIAFEDALTFLDEVTDPQTGRTGYTRRGELPAREDGLEDNWPSEQSEALTAVGLLCRIFADPELERPGWQALVDKGARLVAALPPVWDDDQPGRRDYYHWYYGTYALYQIGGTLWRDWEDSVLDAVVQSQHDAGERRGSWDPQVDPWGHQGGRVYATALMALTMEVYYRYEAILDVR